MGQKVLLADDSITVQKIVKLSLTEEGIEVIALGNGEQAVQQLETLRPDLVMADVFMPGKDGYEVCEFVKSHPQLKHIPVILLVHAFEPFDPDRAKKVGADRQLTKPFQSIRTLVTTVQDLLQGAAEVEPSGAIQKTEMVRVVSIPEPSVASVSPPPTVNQPEEEFAVVSSLTAAASFQTEPEAAFADMTMTGTFAPPAPPSFASITPLPLPEAGLPGSLAGASGMSNMELLPPPELTMLPQTNWQSASPSPGSPKLESFSPSLTPVSLTTEPRLADHSAEDVLELSDVLWADFGGPEKVTETPRAHHFATDDTLVLAVLSAAPTTTEECAAHLPPAESSEPPPSPSFRESFDLGVGQIDLRADTAESASPIQEIKTGTLSSQTAQASMQIPEAVIEEIVNRVVRQLSTKAIQEVAWEVVPEMAELLLRKQISQQQHLTH